MSRTKYWQYLLNEEGQPVDGATIQVYNASTTTPASAYDTESGGTVISGGVLTTDSSGYFQFWCDPDLYPLGMKFNILWSKPGEITSGGVYNIYVPISYEQVNEADTGDTLKNKLVSNALATGWENKPKVFVESGVSASEFIGPIGESGYIETGYDCYHDVTYGSTGLTQSYPLVQVYRNEGRAIYCIPEYINSPVYTVRVWMETSEVYESAYTYNFVLIG